MYRIGGRAHFRGITFESDSARVRVRDNGKDTQTCFSAATHQFKAALKKVPLLRTFAAFGKTGAVFFILLALLLLAEIFFPAALTFNIPDTLMYALAAGIVIFLFAACKPIKRLLQYHGAEHMAVNTYRQGRALTVDDIARADRATPSCGSMFVLVFLIVAIPLMFVPCSDYILPAALVIAFELTLLARRVKWLRWLLRFGMWMQRRIFTRVPDAAQIEVARRGLCTLIALMDEKTEIKKMAADS